MTTPKIYNVSADAAGLTWYTCIDQGSMTRLIVPTVHGFATVSIWEDPRNPVHDGTDLQFIYAGQLHTRSIRGKAYRPRYALTLVRRFVEEIVVEEREAESR